MSHVSNDISLPASIRSLGRTSALWLSEIAHSDIPGNLIGRDPDLASELGQMLSTTSAISTTSSLARQHQAAVELDVKQLIEIGKGQCGTVLAVVGTGEIIKVVNSEAKVEALYNDCVVHLKVLESFSESPQTLRACSLPRFAFWLNELTSDVWQPYHELWPSGQLKPQFGILAQRIFPIPRMIREKIIDLFCPYHLINRAKQDPDNDSCLIRLYFGRRDPGKRLQEKSFRLRNFPLQIEDIETLGLESLRLVSAMADALAVMHWKANVDANDVEFVLGLSATQPKQRTSQEMLSLHPRSPEFAAGYSFLKQRIDLWLLDFNQCTMFDPEKPVDEWMGLLTGAFWFNDPYYPRPAAKHENDRALWQSFKERYLSSSAVFGSNSHALAEEFIGRLEVEGKRRAGGLKFLSQ